MDWLTDKPFCKLYLFDQDRRIQFRESWKILIVIAALPKYYCRSFSSNTICRTKPSTQHYYPFDTSFLHRESKTTRVSFLNHSAVNVMDHPVLHRGTDVFFTPSYPHVGERKNHEWILLLRIPCLCWLGIEPQGNMQKHACWQNCIHQELVWLRES